MSTRTQGAEPIDMVNHLSDRTQDLGQRQAVIASAIGISPQVVAPSGEPVLTPVRTLVALVFRTTLASLGISAFTAGARQYQAGTPRRRADG